MSSDAPHYMGTGALVQTRGQPWVRVSRPMVEEATTFKGRRLAKSSKR